MNDHRLVVFVRKFTTMLILEPLLQVLVVRQDLKMGSGKIASQCARKIATILQYLKIALCVIL